MMTINKTSRFKGDYKLMIKRGFDSKLFAYVVDELAKGHPLERNIMIILCPAACRGLENATSSLTGC
jgi:hypothetical protein